jgi:hypothetical protein
LQLLLQPNPQEKETDHDLRRGAKQLAMSKQNVATQTPVTIADQLCAQMHNCKMRRFPGVEAGVIASITVGDFGFLLDTNPTSRQTRQLW